MDVSQASVMSNGRLVVTPALSICIFWGVMTELHRRGLVQVWQHVETTLGRELRWYVTECMRYKEPLDEEALQMIPTWFEDGMPTRRCYLFYSHGGDHADAISPWCVELHIENTAEVAEDQKALLSAIYGSPKREMGRQVNALRISIPTNGAASSSNQVLELTRYICLKIPIFHGYSGYSLLFDRRIDDLYPQAWGDIARIAMRHPGYDVFDYDAIQHSVFDKLRTVNWITILGPEFAARFVQSERLAYLRNENVRVEELGDNLIIRAGERPQVGDLNEGDKLPLYREVWKGLRPLLSDHHTAFSRIFDKEKTVRWILRFESDE